MSDSIKLSPKHGVNPCIPICFFCGKEKNEIALLGKLPNDKEAPRSAILNYEPCDECTKIMEQGVTILEALDKPIYPHIVPIQKDAYPTGRFCIITKEAANQIFTDRTFKTGDTILVNKELMDCILK